MEIPRQIAFNFMSDEIPKDVMLEEYFPKQMQIYHQAIDQTREQIASSLVESKKQNTLEQQINL